MYMYRFDRSAMFTWAGRVLSVDPFWSFIHWVGGL